MPGEEKLAAYDASGYEILITSIFHLKKQIYMLYIIDHDALFGF